MNRTLLTMSALIGAALLAVSVLLSRQADPVIAATETAMAVESGSAGAGPREAGQLDPLADAEASPFTEFARRIVEVPDTRPAQQAGAPITDERFVTAENIAELVQENLDHALAGDTDSGYFLARARMTCESFAGTPEALDQAMRNMQRRLNYLRERGQSIPARLQYDQPWAIIDDADANRRHLERWYAACERVRDIYSAALRDRLDLLAQRGHVMARYLYAMWPEPVLPSGEAFERQFEWERKARDFSLANLYAGEVVGLLAFGQSYVNGMFTARNHNLALGFGLAALNCGFQNLSINSFLADNLDHLAGSDDPRQIERLQFVVDMADSVGVYCRG